MGLAAAQSDPFRVWIDDWEIGADGDGWRLRAFDEHIEIDLQLKALRSPVLNGVDGLSQKSAEPGNASFAVSGLSWMDREWSSSALSADQAGWDWFALQLSDGSDLMFYNLRKLDGRQDEHSAGTWVGRDGSVTRLDRRDVEITVTDTWASPEGGEYPSRWTLRSPKVGLRLDVVPVMENQELFTTVRYWEGAVDVDGTRNGKALTGRGYVELTGYASTEAQ